MLIVWEIHAKAHHSSWSHGKWATWLLSWKRLRLELLSSSSRSTALSSSEDSPCPTGMTGTVGLAGLRLRRYASVGFSILPKECRCTILPHYMDFKFEQKKKSTKIRICLKHRALPWLTGLVAGLILPSPGFKTMPACVMDTVPLGQDFHWVLRS